MKKERVRQLFTELAKELVASSRTEVTAHTSQDPIVGACVIRNGLVLRGALASAFIEKVENASSYSDVNPTWSGKSLDILFSDHLEMVANGLDEPAIVSRVGMMFGDRLQAQPQHHERKISVFGFADDVDLFEFGLVVFERETIKPEHDFEPFFYKGVTKTVHFGRVTVDAIDQQTAQIRALTLLERHLAVLNALFSNRNLRQRLLSHSFSASSEYLLSSSRDEADQWTHRLSATRLSILTTKLDVAGYYSGRNGIHVNKLLRRSDELAVRIINGLELAGNACSEQTNHTSFLLFVVALESAVLGRDNHQEATYQLAARVAHLVGPDVLSRKAVFARVKKLYAIRSEIVHSGKREISDSHVAEAWKICLDSLLTLTTLSEERGFTSAKEVEDWFHERMLDSST